MRKTGINKKSTKNAEARKPSQKLQIKAKATNIGAADSPWKKEVAYLKGKTFNNEAEAIEAVIEQVLGRIPPNPDREDDTREFLRIMIETDKELQDELRASLRIKS